MKAALVAIAVLGAPTAFGGELPVTEAEFAAAMQGCWYRLDVDGEQTNARVCLEGGVSGELSYLTCGGTVYVDCWTFSSRYEFKEMTFFEDERSDGGDGTVTACEVLLELGRLFTLRNCVVVTYEGGRPGEPIPIEDKSFRSANV